MERLEVWVIVIKSDLSLSLRWMYDVRRMAFRKIFALKRKIIALKNPFQLILNIVLKIIQTVTHSVY